MSTFPLFAVLFFIIPLIEIYLLIQVGSVVGVFMTIFLVVLTAVIGALLLRQQGMSTLRRFQTSMSQGQSPAGEMLEGIALLLGGVLLMTPGFFTDAIGFACLLPFTRRPIINYLIKNGKVKMASNMQRGQTYGSTAQSDRRNPASPKSQGQYDIEGEYVRKDEP